jgi:hypothetical protein
VRRSHSQKHRFDGVLQTAALAVALAGATGSVGLTIFQGRRNPSLLLMGMFAVWVLSPFVALVISLLSSRAWTFPARVMLWGFTVTIAIGSLAVYAGVALGVPQRQPAAFFLVVPMLSWLFVGALLSLRAWLSRK